MARADMNAVTGVPSQSVGAGQGRGGAHASGVRKARGFTLGRRQHLAAWLFLTPAILYVLFAFALPIIYNIMLSFEQTSPATIADITAPFAGLGNYRFILDDPTSRTAIIHTFEFTFGSLVGQFIIGFSLALLFTLRFPGRTLGRSLIIVPWLLPLIVTGLIFRFLFQLEGGAVNQLLMDVGLVHQPIDWLDNPHLALRDGTYREHLARGALLHAPALQRSSRRASTGQGSGPHRRCRRLAEAPPRHSADNPARYRGHSASRVRVHREGVRPGDRTYRRRSGQHDATHHDLVLQLVVPAVLLWRRCRAQQRAARAGDDLRAVVPVHESGFLEAQLGSGEMTRLQRSRTLRWLCTLATVAALVIVLFPVYAVIVGSFESTETLFSGTYYWLPHAATLDNYRTVIQAQSGNVLTSLIVGVGTAVLALVVAVPAAYALAKYRLRVTVVIVSALLVAQIVPSIVLATSLFVIFHWIHLVNTYPGLIIADGTYAIPFSILVLRAFFFSLPNDLTQAARVDGASEWQTFQRIVIPLARSALITVAVFAFLNGWGDFIFALTILNGATIVPVTLGIYTYLGNYSTQWGAVMAAGAFAMVPAAVMLVVAQRYIASGLTAGSVVG